MKTGGKKTVLWNKALQFVFGYFVILALASPCLAADDASPAQKSKEAVSRSAQNVSDGVATLQTRISDNRLVNRTRDENVAFVMMGVLVASVAGMFSKVGCTGLGIAGRLVLGLGGAFIGGMVVRVAEIDFAWGTITIGYEELLFSLLGAVAIVAASRGIQYQLKKKKSK
ncbi:hypothetical protein PDESU_04010 [Pontiella desulfatans]|uniref:Uncharacterized protein n=1 Tax=Pontiella desulfatans TaxID=2750659 RepID=A0A6C2U6J9_PONDE|nr:hypothetical protein [Pontiella desulfatans]VGO15427.1 hypothetical protein PDESU_04010 [Pontiella desulfatans]